MKILFNIITLVITLALFNAVMAAPPDFIPPGHQYGNSNNGGNGGKGGKGGNATQGQAQGQLQLQGQAQGQGQSQSATGIGVGVGVGGSANGTVSSTQANQQSTNVNFESGDYGSTYDEYVASAFAPPLVATSDCLGSASAGGSNSVMGFSVGKTYVDEGCNARMDSRHLWSMGLKEEATLRLCSQPAMVKVLGDRCPAPEPTTEGYDANWYVE